MLMEIDIKAMTEHLNIRATAPGEEKLAVFRALEILRRKLNAPFPQLRMLEQQGEAVFLEVVAKGLGRRERYRLTLLLPCGGSQPGGTRGH